MKVTICDFCQKEAPDNLLDEAENIIKYKNHFDTGNLELCDKCMTKIMDVINANKI
jgi:hypothetical protein